MCRNAITEEIIPLILAEFRVVLRQLKVDFGHSSKHYPPTELYIEHNNVMRNWSHYDKTQTQGKWHITLDQTDQLALDYLLPSPGEQRGMFFERGFGYFAISEEHKTIWLGWQVGPRFGRGYRYKVEIDQADQVSLINPHITWIS